MSMFNDTDWTTQGNSTGCFSNSLKFRDYAKSFQKGHWSFLGLGDEEKRYGTHDNKLEGSGMIPQM